MAKSGNHNSFEKRAPAWRRCRAAICVMFATVGFTEMLYATGRATEMHDVAVKYFTLSQPYQERKLPLFHFGASGTVQRSAPLRRGEIFDGESLKIDLVKEDAPMASNGAQCELRMKKFVDDLDALLNRNPLSIDPFEELLDKYFPVRGCEVASILKIAKNSKFLREIDEWPKEYVIVFDNHEGRNRGYKVSFGLNKESGDSFLPGVINK